MKRKASVYMFAITLLILVSLSLAHASSPKIMSAKTINVPDNYPTIQTAIDAAIAGDTISVASGTYYENVVIAKSLTLKGAGSDITIIDGGGTGTGVKITADNVNISGFTIRNSGDGIHLYMCNGTTVSDNTISSNKFAIYVQSSSGNTIRGNTITSNDLGGLFIGYSSGNTISDNAIASNAHEGVYLYHSSNNTVSGNTITSHIKWPAISLDGSDRNTVSNNTISSNKFGISLYEGSSDNTVVGNTISDNSYVGIELYESSGNTFYHNNFIDNTDQVFPSGTNVWDNGTEGNYWSDYNGTDEDSDGIGDAPYKIDATNKDNNPLMNPYDKTNPVADAGPDQLVVNGTTVTFDGSGSTDNLGIVNYTWTCTDNTTQVLTNVKANYTFCNVGNFSVTLNVSDYSGNWDTDQMWVNVTETKASSTILITVSPASVTVGSNITISGAISPVRAGVNVTIEYRTSGGNWTTLATVTTDSEGKYSYDWTTTEPGSYEIKTSWEGDDNTLADESNVRSVTIKEPTDEKPATDIYLYAAAIAAIIIVSATAVYILRVRKPKPAQQPREQKL